MCEITKCPTCGGDVKEVGMFLEASPPNDSTAYWMERCELAESAMKEIIFMDDINDPNSLSSYLNWKDCLSRGEV